MTNQITPRRGAIHLANFNPSRGREPGKVRPCLVIQNDALNQEMHNTTLVLPLTTQLLTDPLPMRFPVNARHGLRENSQIMIDQIRAIDPQRFCSDELTKLSDAEMDLVGDCLKIVLGTE